MGKVRVCACVRFVVKGCARSDEVHQGIEASNAHANVQYELEWETFQYNGTKLVSIGVSSSITERG